MKNCLTFIMLSLTLIAYSQQNTNLVFFSEQGERFFVILNGIQQNTNGETNVRVTNLNQPYYKVKVRFVETSIPDIDKTLNFNPGTETTYTIKKSSKGEMVLRWMSEVAIQQAPAPTQNQNVVVYHSTATPAVVTQTQTTTVTTETVPNNTENVNMNMNVNMSDPTTNGVNMNVNINTTGTQTQNSNTSYSSTTTTTTTNSTTTNNNQQNTVYVMPGYTGAKGCNGYPMDEVRFKQVLQSIEAKSFEDSKIAMAKQVINTNCMTSDQVKRIMLVFSFEETRLDLAKYAYGYTYDIGNYYLLNDAFTFESSIDELNTYTQSFTR